MLDFNTPVLADKERADAILRSCGYSSSDYCFGNIFIWRTRFELKTAYTGGLIAAKYKKAGRQYYLFPAGTGDKAQAIRDMQADAVKSGERFELHLVTAKMRAELEALMPGKFDFTEDRNNFDYIYNSSDLAELSGKKYHSKRNHLTRFRALGDWSYEEINESNLTECVEMNRQWCKDNDCEGNFGLRQEYCAVIEAAGNYRALSLEGGLLRLYGKVVAFTMGERLDADTFDVHIEKAFSSVEGAYAAINNEFSSRLSGEYRYLNREEDTGDEGLRKAKLSYHPAIILDKYTAVPREGAVL
jgi:hypothetical protein